MKEPFIRFVEIELEPAILLITCGLPGSWKTEAAEEVRRIKGYPIIRTDIVRLEVLKEEDVFDEKVASDMDKRTLVYDEVLRQADEAIDKGGGAILDATFITQPLRRRAAAIAAEHKQTFAILQTSCPQKVSTARILRRNKENYESNALTEQAYLNNKAKFEAVDLNDLKQLYPSLNVLHFIADTQYDPPEEWYVIAANRR
jgi:hypothetical protein